MFGWLKRREPKLPPLPEPRVITVGPNDLVILQVRGRLTKEGADRLREQFSAASHIAAGHIIIVEDGLQLSVMHVESPILSGPAGDEAPPYPVVEAAQA